MAFVEPVVLRRNGLRLEPLGLEHEDGLRAAAQDGELWKIRVTSVPEPENTKLYIEQALTMRAAGSRMAFAVVDEATGKVLGCTSYHDIVPALKRVEIGYTWYAQSVQRTHVNSVLEGVLHSLPDALSRFQVAALLDAMEAAHQLGRLDGLHGQRTDPREDVQLQVPNYLFGVASGPLTVLLRLRMPGSRHHLERIEPRHPIALYLLPAGIPGVNAVGPLPGLIAGLPARHGQGHGWI